MGTWEPRAPPRAAPGWSIRSMIRLFLLTSSVSVTRAEHDLHPALLLELGEKPQFRRTGARATVTIPAQCRALVSAHGSHVVAEWLNLRAGDKGNLSLAEAAGLCQRAGDCKRVLDPIVRWSQAGGHGSPSAAIVATSCLNECSLNGICVAGACRCLPQFAGSDCSVDLCRNNCSGHGLCKNGACWCDPGFRGPGCGEPVGCPKACGGRGKCLHGRCFCDLGFHGLACEVRATCANNCSDHGICDRGTCLCEPGWGNEDCSAVIQVVDPARLAGCPNSCSYHGTCASGRCTCALGYEGPDCSLEARCPVALDNATGLAKPCGAHGICKWFRCFCNPGFHGPACSERVRCPRDCSGRGTCALGRCFCHPGYDGPSCAVETAALTGSRGDPRTARSGSEESSSSSSKRVPSWVVYAGAAVLIAAFAGALGYCCGMRALSAGVRQQRHSRQRGATGDKKRDALSQNGGGNDAYIRGGYRRDSRGTYRSGLLRNDE